MLEKLKQFEIGHLGVIKGGTDNNPFDPPPPITLNSKP